jgi:hypothetical protein
MTMQEQVNLANVPYLPVAAGNTLVRTGGDWTVRKGQDKDDYRYDELAPDGSIVAKYHTWHYTSTYPPFDVDQGWKKFDLTGVVIASGDQR